MSNYQARSQSCAKISRPCPCAIRSIPYFHSLINIRFLFDLSRELLLEDALEGDSVSGELADALTELLDGHLVLVEVESEDGLVLDVSLLLEIEGRSLGSIELLGDIVVGVEEVLEEVGLLTS